MTTTATKPIVRVGDPETSHEAAASIDDVRVSQRIVHMMLHTLARATDESLLQYADEIGFTISPSGLRTRRAELVRLGFVKDSGERETLASGRRAIVWMVSK